MSLNDEASEFIQSKLMCSICQNTCVEPYILGTCNHIYCWGCINGTKELSTDRYVQCPSCRSTSKIPKFYNNNPINEILSGIKSEDYQDLKKDYYEDKHFREQLRLYKKTKKYEIARKYVLGVIINQECILYDDLKKMPQVVDEITLKIILSTDLWHKLVLIQRYVVSNDYSSISDFVASHDLDEKAVNCLLHHHLDMDSVENVGQIEDLSPLYADIYMYTERKRKLILKHFQNHPFGPVSDDEDSETGEYQDSSNGQESDEESENQDNQEEEHQEQESENQENEEEEHQEQESENQESEEEEQQDQESENQENEEEEHQEQESENQESEEEEQQDQESENQESEEDQAPKEEEPINPENWTNEDVEMMRQRAHNLQFMYHSGDMGDTDDNVLKARAKLSKDIKRLVREIQVCNGIEEFNQYLSEFDMEHPIAHINTLIYDKYRYFLFGDSRNYYMMKSILPLWNPKNTNDSNYDKLSDIVRFQLLYSFTRLMRYEVKHNPGDVSFSNEFLPILEDFEKKIKSKLEATLINKHSVDELKEQKEHKEEEYGPSVWKARMTF